MLVHNHPTLILSSRIEETARRSSKPLVVKVVTLTSQSWWNWGREILLQGVLMQIQLPSRPSRSMLMNECCGRWKKRLWISNQFYRAIFGLWPKHRGYFWLIGKLAHRPFWNVLLHRLRIKLPQLNIFTYRFIIFVALFPLSRVHLQDWCNMGRPGQPVSRACHQDIFHKSGT